jgi:hypothetical protein
VITYRGCVVGAGQSSDQVDPQLDSGQPAVVDGEPDGIAHRIGLQRDAVAGDGSVGGRLAGLSGPLGREQRPDDRTRS